ncbi:exonuclease RecJ [Litorimonas taeanensis]|uniref:Single-stranded-DNA-specific exonuclease RecJ n=1 Tax=Litorimonas taeanensis TaxID=568099 RepID=A0A420WKG0_9PROT|nr:single-stranded-DNA-specific exonuclease RecJ [Litorimonas taeanensis]RKQ71412.1 exonuclease RecJ [Litorimonas taeanensis]
MDNTNLSKTALLGVSQSVRKQSWVYRAEEAEVETLLKSTDIPALTARLLAGRGIGPEEVAKFLSPRLRDAMPDPSTLKDMDETVQIIFRAITEKRNVCVFADYDVDGGTSASQLLRWAKGMDQTWSLYVPDRLLEGYGPSVAAFDKLKLSGIELVITVDCGAAAHEALSHATDIGLEVVVIDHHLMDESRPRAKAIVNPNRHDDESGLGNLAAAGVCFMTVVALNREARRRGLRVPVKALDLLGLAALGTVCDVVPLVGLNRAIVSQGLKVLSQQNMAGIEALADIAGLTPPFTTRDAGFGFGPRINAGGRIGVSHMGAELLSTENAQLAYSHAAELDQVNKERRAIQNQIQTEAMQEAEKVDIDNSIIIVSMENWHPGIIGIVAGRIKDRFNKPCLVIGVDKDGVGKGSGRSIKGVNLGAALSKAKSAGLLLSGGGHEMAGGLTVSESKIVPFTKFMQAELAEAVREAQKHQRLKVDAIIHPKAVNLDSLSILNEVAPFGAGNPSPVFVLSDVIIDYAERIKGGPHIRLQIKSRDGSSLRAMAFGADDSGLSESLLTGGNQPVHIAGQIKRNEWNGRVSADFHILDIARAEP